MDTLVDTGEDISQMSIVQVGDLVEITKVHAMNYKQKMRFLKTILPRVQPTLVKFEASHACCRYLNFCSKDQQMSTLNFIIQSDRFRFLLGKS